jgi:hypothetical protein
MEKLPINNGRLPRVLRRVKSAIPELTEADLSYKKGRVDDLLERLEHKTGKGREELISWMTGLSRLKV